jgi:hypothetical protein
MSPNWLLDTFKRVNLKIIVSKLRNLVKISLVHLLSCPIPASCLATRLNTKATAYSFRLLRNCVDERRGLYTLVPVSLVEYIDH